MSEIPAVYAPVMQAMLRNRNKNGAGAADFAGAGTPVKFNSVDFRDGQQSLFATRMRTEDMLPLLERMDAVGYDNMEMWGGATFDVAIRFLREDPWERVRIFKQHVKNTLLKMELRGQNLVGYHAYPGARTLPVPVLAFSRTPTQVLE